MSLAFLIGACSSEGAGGVPNLNVPVSKGEGNDALLVNNTDLNEANGEYSSAFGDGTAAGAFGFKIKELNRYPSTNTARYVITHDDEGIVYEHLTLLQTYAKSETLTASVIYSNNYDLCGIVTKVYPIWTTAADGTKSGAIEINNIPQTIKGTGLTLVPESDPNWSPTNSINTIRIFEHPELGNIDVGTGSFVAGMASKALAEMAIALGYGAVAAGRCGMAVNRGTLAVWGAFAANEYTKAINLAASSFGRYTQALGEASFSRGITTKAIGHGSDASGNHTEARGGASHTGGDHTIAKEDYQSAIGTYNRDESTAGLIVGNGDSTTRSNAFTAGTKDGVAYVSIGDSSLTINTDACADLATWECVGDGSGREYYKQSTVGGIITVRVARAISKRHNADTSQVNGATVKPGVIWGGWSLITGGVGEAVLIIIDQSDTSKSTTIRYTATADDNVVAAVSGYDKMGTDRRYCRYHFNISDYTALPLDSDPRIKHDFSGKSVQIKIGLVPKADPDCEPIIIWTRTVNIAVK